MTTNRVRAASKSQSIVFKETSRSYEDDKITLPLTRHLAFSNLIKENWIIYLIKELDADSSMDKETQEYIINVLRRGTITWSGRTECLNRGRRQRKIGVLKKGGDKCVWERDCDNCGEWFLLKDNVLEVDHIVEIGPFLGDWKDFIYRMYCGQDNLQALCFVCHAKKTSKFNSTLRYQRKVKNALDEL